MEAEQQYGPNYRYHTTLLSTSYYLDRLWTGSCNERINLWHLIDLSSYFHTPFTCWMESRMDGRCHTASLEYERTQSQPQATLCAAKDTMRRRRVVLSCGLSVPQLRLVRGTHSAAPPHRRVVVRQALCSVQY